MSQTKPEEKKRELTQLVPTRRALAEAVMRVHVVTVESPEHPEDFLEPEFWALVAKEFTVGDRVEIRDDGMTYWAEFLVLACDRTWAKVHKLREHRLVPVEELQLSDDFTIQYKGPHLKWCVLRVSDNSIVHEGEQERTGAVTWLDGYLRVVGATKKPAAAKKAA